MSKNFSRYMLAAGTTALIGIYAPYLLQQVKPETTILSVFPYTVFFIFIASAVGHFFLSKALDKNPKTFINLFMAVMGIKLFVYFGFLIVYVFTHKTTAVPFLIWFMIYYGMFMVIDLAFLLTQNSKTK